MKENDSLPCWITFYKEGRKAGWSHKKILLTIDTEGRDIWGSSFIDKVLSLLDEVSKPPTVP